MRLVRQSVHGLTVYRQPASIDFAELGPGLVSVVGRNGGGKTSFLDAAMGSLDKALPTRPGSLYDHCHGRDAYIETVWQDGPDEVKVRVQVDADRRVTEGYVFVNGEPVTTGRAAEFEAEVLRRFGSRELRLASVFASQDKSGNFLTMRKGSRKELFAELLGLGTLEVLCQAARDRRGATDCALEIGRNSAHQLEREVAGLPFVERDLHDAQDDVDAEAKRLDTARAEEAAAQAALERARTAGERIGALQQAEASARQAVVSADAELRRAAEAPVAAKRRRDDRLAAVAARRVEDLEPAAARRRDERLEAIRVRQVEELEPAARRRHQDAVAALTRRATDARAVLGEEPAITEAAARRLRLRDDRARLEDERRSIEALRPARERAERDAATANVRLRELVKAREDQVADLRRRAGLLGAVPCTAQATWCEPVPAGEESPETDLAGTCPLLNDARGAKAKADALAGAPSDAEVRAKRAADDAMAAWRKAQEDEAAGLQRQSGVLRRLQDLDLEIPTVEALVGRQALLEAARRTLDEVSTEARSAANQLAADLEAADLAIGRASADQSAAAVAYAAEVEAARQAAAEASADRPRIEAEYEAALLEADDACRAARAALEIAQDRHREAEAALARARAEADGRSVATCEDDLDRLRRERQADEQDLRAADQKAATLRARLEQLQGRAAELERMRADVASIEEDLGDWRLLEQALGKDGVQALEIDAAGPEVAQLTNELLTACYGPRFSIAFETLRTKRDGGQAEAFDVRVFDGGHERPVEALSGGERVVVGEAVGLALAIYNARKNAVRFETFWRDETAGALDPENAAAYVRMLRRARELAGAFQIVFVAHQPEVYEAADVRLVVEGGRIQVEAATAA
jgi:exonuclease SbcC